jgi:hypothetical protein
VGAWERGYIWMSASLLDVAGPCRPVCLVFLTCPFPKFMLTLTSGIDWSDWRNTGYCNRTALCISLSFCHGVDCLSLSSFSCGLTAGTANTACNLCEHSCVKWVLCTCTEHTACNMHASQWLVVMHDTFISAECYCQNPPPPVQHDSYWIIGSIILNW